MSVKNNNVNNSLQTRNLADIAAQTGNVYRSIAIVGKRARQLSNDLKEELNGKLAEFVTAVDNLEEVFENREQIDISRHYERMPKPSQLAVEEFIAGKIYHRERGEDDATEGDEGVR
ncbi:MAG: DNA-directed RNA polymerase subunit omega [Catalinimonas sp.]